MTSREFVYWLQGVFEVAEPKTLDAKQTELIRRHLALVFTHEIDPSYPNKEKLDAIHAGPTGPSGYPFDSGAHGAGGGPVYRC